MDAIEARELRRQEIINNAVRAADRIILDGSDGTIEELNYLTAQVAREFVLKAFITFTTALAKIDLGLTTLE